MVTDISGNISILSNQVKIKFDSTEYIPVPSDWYDVSGDNISVRQNASNSGQIKIVTIRNRGVGLGTAM